MNTQQRIAELNVEYQATFFEGQNPECKLSQHDANRICREIKQEIQKLNHETYGCALADNIKH